VQSSVFTARMTGAELDERLAALAELLDATTDSPIAVRQCQDCAQEQQSLGQHRGLSEQWWVLM